MATAKCLSLICESPNFPNGYLGEVMKLQGYGFFRFGVLRNGGGKQPYWSGGGKQPPPPPRTLLHINMVKIRLIHIP